MLFSEIILQWYAEHKRKLPWRSTSDPYKIWLSEIILQQTRVVQGIPYYQKFITNYPDIRALAFAKEEEVLKLWQGLGYYSRARNLHKTAKIVHEEYGDVFPRTYKGLLELPGIGPYTAAAIASICYLEPKAVVDGNVYRVLSRFFGVDLPVNTTTGIRYFNELAQEVMDKKNIRDYNQGIMEFGALQCAPKSPDCERCPLQGSCAAFMEHRVGSLPVKLSKTRVKKRFFNYWVPLSPDLRTEMFPRKAGDIWQGLYEFPLVESPNLLDASFLENVVQADLSKLNVSVRRIFKFNSDPVLHKLSHQELHTNFWIVETEESWPTSKPLSVIEEYPVPVLIANFLNTMKNAYF